MYNHPMGRLQPAPESFVNTGELAPALTSVARRRLLRGAFAVAGAALGAGAVRAQASPVPAKGGDLSILDLPPQALSLGQTVALEGYGKPSKYESHLQRRPSRA